MYLHSFVAQTSEPPLHTCIILVTFVFLLAAAAKLHVVACVHRNDDIMARCV